MAKNVLVITYDFPPAGGAGMKRLVKFIHYLPKFGWNPAVLTVRSGSPALMDASLLKELPPELPVFRAFTLERLFKRGPSHAAGGAEGPAQPAAGRRLSIKRLVGSVYKRLGRLFSMPDSRILWLPAALLRGVLLVITRRINVIFASGPSFTNVILGAMIKAFTRVPLVVDFRDAWTADPMTVPPSWMVKAANNALERFVIRSADRVVGTNPFVTRDFAERYGPASSTKWDTIYNGFDPRDAAMMREYTPHRYNGKFVLVYTGRLYRERTPYHYMRALAAALQKRPAMRADTRVLFVGSCETFTDGRTVSDYGRELGMLDLIEMPGHLSRRESLELQMEATVLVLLIGIVAPEKQLTYGISGKVFDYVISDRPILAIADPGASRWFLETNGIGAVYSHADEAGITDYLVKAWDTWRSGARLPTASRSLCDDFSFESLSGKLARHLAAAGARSTTL